MAKQVKSNPKKLPPKKKQDMFNSKSPIGNYKKKK